MRERVGAPSDLQQCYVDVVTWLRQTHANDASALAAAMEIIVEEEDNAFDPPGLQPAVKECILALQNRGVKLGIFTRNTRHNVESFLRHAGLPSDTFGPVVTRDSAVVNKPSAEPVLHCCKAWGIDPSEALWSGTAWTISSLARLRAALRWQS